MDVAQVRLVLEDCFGHGIGVPVRVAVSGPTATKERGVEVQRELMLVGLMPGEYHIKIEPEDYEPVEGRFVLRDGAITEAHYAFMIPTPQVAGIDALEYGALDQSLKKVLEASRIVIARTGRVVSGREWYESLEDSSKARLLNVYAKASHTPLANGEPAFDLFGRVQRIDDRGVWFHPRGRVDALVSPTFTRMESAQVGPHAHVSGERMYTTEEGATSLSFSLPKPRFWFPRSLSTVSANVGTPTTAETAADPFVVGQELVRSNIRPAYELITHRRKRQEGRPVHGASHIDFARLQPHEPIVIVDTRRHETISPFESAIMTAPETKPLTVTHWIEGVDENPQPVEQAPLLTDQPYWYWFQIAVTARPGGSVDVFTPLAELEQAETSRVVLAVRSTLLAAGTVERRQVTYQRGVGIAAQSFELSPVSGDHTLVSQVIWRNQIIYSKSWQLRVEGEAGDEATTSEASSTAGPTAPSPEGASASADDRVYRLVVDPGSRVLEFEAQGARKVPEPLTIELTAMVHLAADARRKLTAFAQKQPAEADGVVDRANGLALLRDMAKWGTRAFEAIFGQPPHRIVGDLLASAPDGCILQVDGDPATFPWEWLYLGSVDQIAHAETHPEDFLKGFLGYRLALTVLPTAHYDVTNISLRLLNTTSTNLLAAVNTTTDETGGPGTQAFLERLSHRKTLTTDVRVGKAAAVEGLKAMLTSRPHLLYFYAHHKSGAQLNEYGYHGFSDATLYMKGRTEDPLTNDELRFDVNLKPFSVELAPLVFLNACGTAQGGEFLPSGFIPYFTTKLGAPAVIGTHAEIPAVAAYRFACDFLTQWLGGAMLGQALREVRRAWLQQMNPYAMYYTAHGSGLLRLAKAVP